MVPAKAVREAPDWGMGQSRIGFASLKVLYSNGMQILAIAVFLSCGLDSERLTEAEISVYDLDSNVPLRGAR